MTYPKADKDENNQHIIKHLIAHESLIDALHHALAALDDAQRLHPNWIYSDAQRAAKAALELAEGEK